MALSREGRFVRVLRGGQCTDTVTTRPGWRAISCCLGGSALYATTALVHEPTASAVRSPYLADLLTLVAAAERAGLRSRRAAAWRARLAATPADDALLLRLESRLRGWIARQTSRLLH